MSQNPLETRDSGALQGPQDVTRLLREWREGDASALAELYPQVYEELRRRARAYLRRERPDHTLQPTALVHETYLKLSDKDHPRWRSREHFFAVAAQLMRRILVDHARGRAAAKRGGSAVMVPLDEAVDHPDRPGGADGGAADLLALDEALRDLAAFDERKARLVELRFFGGASLEEVARLLEVSVPTVVREARMARAWLHRRIHGPTASPDPALGPEAGE